ncbi:MAG: hypothetical protein ABF868_07325 [Sporolactobacillus sp.]
MYSMTLNNFIDIAGKEGVKTALSNFYCFVKGYPSTIAVQNFFRNEAYSNNAQDYSRTHVCFDDDAQLVGLYTLKVKDYEVTAPSSNTEGKRYGIHNRKVETFLIAQLAKTQDQGLHTDVTGEEILKDACSNLKLAYQIIGSTRSIAVEYANDPKLIDFYEGFGFHYIQDHPVTHNRLALYDFRSISDSDE